LIICTLVKFFGGTVRFFSYAGKYGVSMTKSMSTYQSFSHITKATPTHFTGEVRRPWLFTWPSPWVSLSAGEPSSVGGFQGASWRCLGRRSAGRPPGRRRYDARCMSSSPSESACSLRTSLRSSRSHSWEARSVLSWWLPCCWHTAASTRRSPGSSSAPSAWAGTRAAYCYYKQMATQTVEREPLLRGKRGYLVWQPVPTWPNLSFGWYTL